MLLPRRFCSHRQVQKTQTKLSRDQWLETLKSFREKIESSLGSLLQDLYHDF